jgi:sugar-specific transcriptional regulator TrmB
MILERFGFTPTEAKVYAALLISGPSTGYSVARTAGFARANAYQALEGLVRLGAARKTATKPPRFIAIPPPTLVGDLERRVRRDFDALQAELSEAAKGTAAAPVDAEPLYDEATLLARAEQCASGTNEELLAVLGPWAERLYPTLGQLRSRRRNVRLLALGEPAPQGAIVRPVSERELVAYWGGRPLLLVSDRTTAVCGTLHEDGAVSGLATASPGVVPFLRHLLRREIASASAGA